MLKMVSVKGPTSYTSPGFGVIVPGIQQIHQSSGLQAMVGVSGSSFYIAQVVSCTGNQVNVMVRDSRSGGIEVVASTDLSPQNFTVIAEGF